jgi:hypothetical protein
MNKITDMKDESLTEVKKLGAGGWGLGAGG